MSRRSIELLSDFRDGTSQRGRGLPALDPGSVAIDERGHAELLEYVRALAGKLRFFEAIGDEVRDVGDWEAFIHRDDVSIADIVAYMKDPERFQGGKARWLGRPHFALLLAFLELLGHAREQLNGFTRRHLDYYYREILQMVPERARPDRATVVFRLAPKVAAVRLPAGTALRAGRDSSGLPRIYKTERDLLITRARVDDLRSIHVDRRITGIRDVRKDVDLTASEVLERMLSIGLGDPGPGDPVPPWGAQTIDAEFIRGLRGGLDFAREQVGLEQHELRKLMQLVRRRTDADHEWREISRLLGVEVPPILRDFSAILEKAVGVLDFKVSDGLEQVNNIDDLYHYRDEPKVLEYILGTFKHIGADDEAREKNFCALMRIKLRIDAEWAEINRLLDRVAGGRAWRPESFDPADFETNLALALGDQVPPWPWGASLGEYEATLRGLEAHFSMTVERLTRVVAIAAMAEGSGEPGDVEWSELDRILADAHREKHHAARRQRLAEVRGDAVDLVGFGTVVRAALPVALRSDDEVITEANEDQKWQEALPLLRMHLQPGQIALLEDFRGQFSDPAAPRRVGWDDVYRVLELAQRYDEALPEPVAETIEWRNMVAYEDATALAEDPASPRWTTFGRRPAPSDPPRPDVAFGWGVCSPLLALSQGRRTLTLTLGFAPFDAASFLREFGLPSDASAEALRAALGEVLRFEIGSAKGWVELELTGSKLAPGTADDDYWTLLGVPAAVDEKRPGLRLVLAADDAAQPFAPLPGAPEPWPTLRVTLRPIAVGGGTERVTRFGPFEPLVLAALHLHVKVEGLTDLRLQHEDRPLDPGRPFEPFGSRPLPGARMYLSHPELVRARLAALRLDIEWMGLPPSLKAHYSGYAPELDVAGAAYFRGTLTLVDNNLELPLDERQLFSDDQDATTHALHAVDIPQVDALIVEQYPKYRYVSRPDLTPAADLRASGRYLRWELTPRDFGHAMYPSLAAQRARALAAHLADSKIESKTPDMFGIHPPYTPTIKRLRVTYETACEFPSGVAGRGDRLLHVHPFGTSAIDLSATDPADRRLFPRYDAAGELYIGLRDVDAPQPLALLVQLAEGTSDPDLEPASVEWSALDGDRWLPLAGKILHDSTRGLVNSGIVELQLPAVAPSARLPAGRYWLRAAIARSPASVCDTVAIRAQAVTVCFDDRNNAPSHYEQPLPVRSIDRLLAPDVRIAAVEQPYTSFGGKPPERTEQFYTRVSERLRHRQRALTPWDYERLVLQRFPQIYKAKCLSAGAVDLSPGRVDIIVIPDIRAKLPADAFAPKAPANLLADIQAYLAERAPPSARVVVRNARYVAVSVRLGVRFRAGQDERYAQQRLSEDLNRYLSPWAYDEGAELVIGGKIYANSILDFVDRRDYVDYVAELKLFRSEDGHDFKAVLPPADGGAYHVTTARPDQVLVAARQHHIDVITELEYQQTSFTGINYMKIELDFIVR